MITENTDTQHLAPYVCPTCRILFSTIVETVDNGITCPGCGNVLSVLAADAAQVESLDLKREYTNDVSVSLHQGVHDHPQMAMKKESQEWEDEQVIADNKGMRLLLFLSIMSIALIGTLGYLLLFVNKKEVDQPSIVNTAVIPEENTPENVNEPLIENVSEIYEYKDDDEDQVARLNEFLTNLYAAKTVDEMLPYVRPVKDIRKKMIRFYGGEATPYNPFQKLVNAKNLKDDPMYLRYTSLQKDYSKLNGTLLYTRESILLDWESYTVYSEISWKDLIEKRPTKVVRLRVNLMKSNYYNEDYSDDKTWQAILLESSNGVEPIYGYVARDSAVFEKLLDVLKLGNKKAVIVDVRYPKNAKTENQVIIQKMVQNGWIMKKEK